MTITMRPLPAQPSQAKEFSDWHEGLIEHLAGRSGHHVEREPNISGKTPDLRVTPNQGPTFIIECMARLQDPYHAMELTEHGWHHCGGNIRELHQNVYSRLEHKATKYRHIADDMPYVIALYDASCMNSLDTAVDLVLSPYAPTIVRDAAGKVAGKHYNTLWPQPEIPAALFELYPHLSGMVYSRYPREHYYLPNPYATKRLSTNLFPFARIPELNNRYRQHELSPRPATVVDDYDPPPEAWLPQMELLANSLNADAIMVA